MQQTQFIWSGHYYLKGDEKIELTFKDFSCPEEGGPIIGHTADNRTAKGTIQSNRQVDFTLEGTNGESILYFQGKLGKDEDLIVGNYGVEEGEHDKHFKLFRKTKEVVLQKCFGYYWKSDKQTKLTFQDFKCPTEGGVITGHTIDGRTLQGTIKSNRKLNFILKAINGDQTLYFEGQLTKDKKSIIGSYGTEENETPDAFKLFIEEVLTRWSGYQMKDDKKIELVFKSFFCPTQLGTITGYTIDGEKVKGTIKSDRKLNFTLVPINGDQTLYFEGQLTKDEKSIVGSYGTEENETPDAFKLFLKELQSKEEVVQKWSGYYLQGEKQFKLVFKSFSCPTTTEGGTITGFTNDDRKVNGTSSDLKVNFELEAANGERKIYFWGKISQDKNYVVGDWGFVKDEIDGQFKLNKEEQEVTIWAGYYLWEQKRVDLTFKDFICPLEGGEITGHTLEGKTVKGKIYKDKKVKVNFTLQANNGDPTLHFEGVFNAEKKLIVGSYGVVKEDADGEFKIFIKDAKLVKSQEKWSGYYKRDLDNGLKSAMKIPLKLKKFGYSLEKSLVNGETEDGLDVKGTINNDLRIEFTIKNQKRRLIIFFQGKMKEDKKSICEGTYGFSKDKKEGMFELFKEEEIPNQPACVCNCLKCRKTLSVEIIKLDNWVCDVCHHEKDKGSQVYKCNPDKWGCCQTCAQAIAKGNCICGQCGSSVEKSNFEYQNGNMLCNVCKEPVPSGSDVYHCTDNWDCCVSCYEVQYQGKQPKPKPQPKPSDSDEKKKVCPCGRCGQLLQISECYLKGTITCDVCYGEIRQGSQEFQCRQDNWDICLPCANAKNGGNKPNPEEPQPYPVQPKPQPDYPVTIPDNNRNYSQEMTQAISFVDNIISIGKPWTDQKFPPQLSSLANSDDSYQDQNNMQQRVGNWQRASEIYQGISLFGNKIDPSDVYQGALGDCYFLATLSAVAEEPSRVKARFYTKELNKAGIYLMFFFINGRETPVYVDEYIPVSRYSRQEASFAKFHGNKLWVMLMEKAWAKICGTYARSDGGFPGIAAEHVLGVTSDVIHHSYLQHNMNAIWAKFLEADRRKFVMMAGTDQRGQNREGRRYNGILDGHAYTVISFHELEGNKLVRIRNPHGKGEWTGDFSDNSRKWSESLKSQLDYRCEEDGIFYMPFQNFIDEFQATWICADDDILGRDVHSNIEYQFRYNEEVSFTFELKQQIDVEKSMFIVSCIQQGPRIEYERRRNVSSRQGFTPSRFNVTLKTKNQKKIFDSYAEAEACLNPAYFVKKEQGIIHPGTYIISIRPQWNETAHSKDDFKKILLDIYCPEVLTITKLS